MKRSVKELQRDERERQEDELLRAQLEREEVAEAAQKRQKSKDDNYSKKWKEILSKWDEHGLQCASECELRLPVPDPPGPQSSSLVLIFVD